VVEDRQEADRHRAPARPWRLRPRVAREVPLDGEAPLSDHPDRRTRSMSLSRPTRRTARRRRASIGS